MKTCKHFRNQVPSEYANELRALDKEPCEVCDTKERLIICETDTESNYYYIPKFQTSIVE
jgi:uncharacterized UBP type Zn finger protein